MLAMNLRPIGKVKRISEQEYRLEIWIEEVGYEERPLQLSIRTEGEDRRVIDRAMSDFAIGLRSELPVTVKSADITRFGIKKPADYPFVRRPGISLRADPPDLGSARIVVEGGDERGSFSGSFFSSQAMFPFLTAEVSQARVCGRYLSIVFDKARCQFTFTLGDEAKANLSEVADAARAFIMLQDREAAELSAWLEHKGETMALQFETKAGNVTPELRNILNAILEAQIISEAVKLPHDTVVNLGHLSNQFQTLTIVSKLLNGDETPASFKAFIDGNSDASNSAVTVIFTAVRIGGYAVCLGWALTGPPVRGKDPEQGQFVSIEGAAELWSCPVSVDRLITQPAPPCAW